MKSEPISAPKVRDEMRTLGALKMDGANHDRFEIWLGEDGQPYMLPYHKPGNRRTFEKQPALNVLRELRNGRDLDEDD